MYYLSDLCVGWSLDYFSRYLWCMDSLNEWISYKRWCNCLSIFSIFLSQVYRCSRLTGIGRTLLHKIMLKLLLAELIFKIYILGLFADFITCCMLYKYIISGSINKYNIFGPGVRWWIGAGEPCHLILTLFEQDNLFLEFILFAYVDICFRVALCTHISWQPVLCYNLCGVVVYR